MSYKAEMVEAIFRLKPRDGQFSIESLALLTITDDGRATSISDHEIASRYRRSIFSAVLERNEAIVQRGGLATFDVVSMGSFLMRWRQSTTVARRHRQWITLRSCIAKWLDGLDDRAYELASGFAMMCLGATRVHVTPHGNDFGIDFIAIVPAYTSNPLFMSGARGVRIIGQSKKYNTPVSREKVQSFNDCLTSVRNNRAELTEIIPGWFWGSSAPMLSCFVSHSGFQSGSLIMAGQAGHILLDTLELAEIIARIKSHDASRPDTEIHRGLWARIMDLEVPAHAA